MSENIQIFEVGGSIRNEILGLPCKDRDFSVLAPSYEAMKAHVLGLGGVIYQERPEYVSLKAKLPKLGATDFTLARRESFYTDARHPDSVSPAETIEDDLARRDFRMNAIARNIETGEIIDPFNGRQDIADKLIQSVGNAKQRFDEDRLRVFRAFRFAVVLNFYIHPLVRNAMKAFDAHEFAALPAEMMQIELWKAFASDTSEAFYLLQEFPELVKVMKANNIRLKPTLEK
jgi:tRNA nucleotidyltransferase (CCA-adding enzyme)